MKKGWMILLLLVLLGGGAIITILVQNDFAINEQAVTINTPSGRLTGVLALPEEYSGKLGLVLFIHGDGPIDATHNDGYKPLWERLASLGYASLSMNKRGIEGSEGSWLEQSMEDRVEEAQQAIAWSRTQPMIDGDRIGVWGASQAGWVVPKLAGQEPLAFSILVSPAINWLSQGEYYTRSRMAKEGRSQAEIGQQIAYEKGINGLLRREASYEDYVASAKSDEAMTRERWAFVSKNYRSDATADLRHFHSPVLLLLGAADRNVDIKETERIYRLTVQPSDLLHIRVFKETEHSMLPLSTADSPLRAWMISLFAPRRITVDGYMEEIEDFLVHL
ncbi:hypothetical protein FHS18_004807 [Paenibacillus phyllosphaerae]|uniref:Serine aminopeptidase S33 domain-containing protein n=1 Tax=Paenibacillus phyllosphaerae TaxID=274593 RepID=A0A7W5FPS9_9BACL|nr:alpha/beta hydrolase [Paenibacillus phyllosphaerae]MBB3112705.1 hypothetical protein [Paenibacillus phyllosphaerae]